MISQGRARLQTVFVGELEMDTAVDSACIFRCLQIDVESPGLGDVHGREFKPASTENRI
jgi:hypothetical protein